MASIESNSDDWREIRSRVDSIANAVFLIAGGALSLSVSVLVDGKASGIVSEEVANLAATSWYCLLGAVVFFLLLKADLVLQAYLLQFKAEFVNNNLGKLNGAAWGLGLAGFVLFIVGLACMVRTAVLVVRT